VASVLVGLVTGTQDRLNDTDPLNGTMTVTRTLSRCIKVTQVYFSAEVCQWDHEAHWQATSEGLVGSPVKT
jgi:hypothetical protein